MIRYQANPTLDNRSLNALFAASWDDSIERDFGPVLERSLGYVGVFDDGRLIGFVNLAWDGGEHAFLLDTTVDPQYRRRGIGTALVKEGIRIAERAAVRWIHVDFEKPLTSFYLEACGFVPSAAGVMCLA